MTDIDPLPRHKFRVEALLTAADSGGDHRLRQLFQTSAEFHAVIETLARAMPEFVESIAKRSRETMERQEELIELIRNSPLPPWQDKVREAWSPEDRP